MRGRQNQGGDRRPETEVDGKGKDKKMRRSGRFKMRINMLRNIHSADAGGITGL
jgi:hypothetical protein